MDVVVCLNKLTYLTVTRLASQTESRQNWLNDSAPGRALVGIEVCQLHTIESPARLLSRPLTCTTPKPKGQATLCVQSAQYRMRSSEIAFLRTVLVWLSTCIPFQLNILSDYAITQYRTNASEIAHLVRIVCSDLNATMTTSGLRQWELIQRDCGASWPQMASHRYWVQLMAGELSKELRTPLS